jgi:hypothetical protein
MLKEILFTYYSFYILMTMASPTFLSFVGSATDARRKGLGFFLYLYIEAGRRDILLRKEVEGRRACSKSCLAKKMVMITDDVTPVLVGPRF